ncbi:MAG: lactate racemase [Clostridia bacterium]|nr:lactate racemase [Clostridia bacterium]MDN5322708.1 lactate racemase [Clostridia bacterium]
MGDVIVKLPYGGPEIEVPIPEENLIGVYSPKDMEPVQDVEAEVKRALANPIGAASLGELVKGKEKVVIVADDNTRLTPTDKIIPVMLEEMNKAGVKDEQITIVIALGTHRDMTDEEILAKFGEEVVKRVKIVNHDFIHSKALVDLGTTPNGTPISINKIAYEADFKIGIGSIVPHHIPGFAGGAKIVQPGISGLVTTGSTHLLSVQEKRSYLGIEDNPVRRELNQIARKIGMNVIFNTVLDRYGRVIRGFYGDLVEAFKKGVDLSKDVYAVKIPEEADIVLASSHPCDLEFWQAHKTLYAADRAVKENGIIIVVTPCPEGVSKVHGEMIEITGKHSSEIRRMVDNGELEDLTAAALAIAWAQVKERETVYIVSEGITDEEAIKLGFTPFDTVQAALKQAFSEKGRGAKVTVLTHAPDTLPIIG